MGDSSDEKRGLPARINGTTDLQAVQALFVPRSDITYRTIENVTLADLSLHQSLLTGTLLRGCTFTNVDFSRCDLDGMRIESCKFHHCQINVDLRSTAIMKSEFQDCSFAHGLLSDCSFADSALVKCAFNSTAVSDCSFSRSSFVECNLRESSFTQNRFVDTTFERTTLGDCTFLYAIMKRCRFVDARINAESVGMIYGLGADDVRKSGLLFLGQEQETPDQTDIIHALVESYRQRRWAIGSAVMSINFGLSSIAYAFREYLTALRASMVIKRDELLFVTAMMTDLADDGRLPLMSCIDAVESAATIAERLDEGEDDSRTGSVLQTFSSKTLMTMQRMTEEFEAKRLPFSADTPDRVVRCRLTFAEKPSIDVSEIMNEVAQASGFRIAAPTRLLHSDRGSYVEVVTTTLGTLAAVQLTIFLLNGCIVQMTQLRARWALMTRKRMVPELLKNALEPQPPLPAFLLAPIRSILGHVLGIPWLQDPHLKGLPPPNLVEATIEDDSADSEGSEKPK